MSMKPGFEVRPVTLEGEHVRLETLDLARHGPGLEAIGLDPVLWRFTMQRIHTIEELHDYLATAAEELRTGVALPFATIHRASGAVAGCTRFGNIVPEHLRVEIGWTWVGEAFRRTAVNTEAKRLMFRHAFETWGVQRVELKTSGLNLPSQNAMRRLGLVEEGTLRRHVIQDDGTPRDNVYFSVIREEWPAMDARLAAMLAR